MLLEDGWGTISSYRQLLTDNSQGKIRNPKSETNSNSETQIAKTSGSPAGGTGLVKNTKPEIATVQRCYRELTRMYANDDERSTEARSAVAEMHFIGELLFRVHSRPFAVGKARLGLFYHVQRDVLRFQFGAFE